MYSQKQLLREKKTKKKSTSTKHSGMNMVKKHTTTKSTNKKGKKKIEKFSKGTKYTGIYTVKDIYTSKYKNIFLRKKQNKKRKTF